MRNPNATDAATATTLQQDGWESSYLEIVLGSEKDFESESDAAKEQERSEQDLFLSAVEKLAVKRI